MTTVSEMLKQFEEDLKWVQQNKPLLIKQYAEQWIGVKNGKVIANHPDMLELKSQLPDPSHTFVEFITEETIEMIL